MEHAEDANRHAPRLGNSSQTLEDVLEDVHAAYELARRCEFYFKNMELLFFYIYKSRLLGNP